MATVAPAAAVFVVRIPLTRTLSPSAGRVRVRG